MIDVIKSLREKTGAGMMDCKHALKDAGGDAEKAIEILRKKGLSKAHEKSSRTTKEGVVQSYVHTNSRIGVLVEVNCETDFVARNDEFRTFARDMAMQVAAARPMYVKKEDVPQSVVEKEKEIIKAQMTGPNEKGKPEHVLEKIVLGKLEKFYEEVCLLEQLFIKDQTVKVNDLLVGLIAKTGENISIRRFTRYQLGDE